MCTYPLGILLKCRLCNYRKLPGDVDAAIKSSKVLEGLAWFGASLDLGYHSERHKQGKSWNISISRLTEGPVFYNLVFYDLSLQSRDCHQVITLSIMCAISHSNTHGLSFFNLGGVVRGRRWQPQIRHHFHDTNHMLFIYLKCLRVWVCCVESDVVKIQTLLWGARDCIASQKYFWKECNLPRKIAKVVFGDMV